MIPIRDNIPHRSIPVVNYGIIGVCTVVVFFQLADAPGSLMIEKYALIPVRLVRFSPPVREVYLVRQGPFVTESVRERPMADPPFGAWLTPLTCIFLHGGWMHFLGNMWFLHLFGNNVEDRFGKIGYLVFYLGCGVAASLVHFLTNFLSATPTLGASGAIAGVMGAYMVLYPRAMVLTVIPLGFLFPWITVPAPIFLGIWFLMQFFQGAFAIVTMTAGGVAWWAHIGGFAAGFYIAKQLEASDHLNPRVDWVLPNTGDLGRYR